MWQDYAKARGLVAANLTQAQKVEAEYLGIIEETSMQVGDAAKLTGTLAGAQADAAMSGKLLSQAYGQDLAPALKAGTKMWGSFLSGMKDIVTAAPGLASSLTGAAGAMTMLVMAGNGLKLIQQNWKAISTLFTGPVGWVALAGGILAAGITAFVDASERAAEAERKIAEERQANISSMKTEIETLSDLEKEYGTLDAKTDKTVAEKKRLSEIEQILSDQYDIALEGLGGQKKGHDELAVAIRDVARAEKEKMAAMQAADAAYRLSEATKATMELDTEAAQGQIRGPIDQARAEVRTLEQKIFDLRNSGQALVGNRIVQYGAEEAERMATELQVLLDAANNKLDQEIQTQLVPRIAIAWDLISSTIRTKSPDVSNAVLEVIRGAYEQLAATDPSKATQEFADKFAAGFEEVDFSSLFDKFKQDTKDFKPFDQLEGDDLMAYEAKLSQFVNDVDVYAKQIADSLSIDPEIFAGAFTGAAQRAVTSLQSIETTSNSTTGALEEMTKAMTSAELAESSRKNAEAIHKEQEAVKTLQDERKQGTQEFLDAQKLIAESYGNLPYDEVSAMLETQLQAEQAALDLAKAKALVRLEELATQKSALEEESKRINAEKTGSDNAEERARIARELLATEVEIARQQAIGAMNLDDVIKIGDLPKETKAATDELQKLDKQARDLVQNKRFNESLLQMAKSAKESKTAFAQLDPALRQFATDNNMAGASIGDIIKALEKKQKALSKDATSTLDSIMGVRDAWIDQRTALEQQPTLNVDDTAMVEKLNRNIMLANFLVKLLGGNGVEPTETKSKGGGGSSKKKQAEEEARRAAEAAQKAYEDAMRKAMDAELKLIQRRRDNNEINTKQEIAELERVYERYKHLAELREQMEDRIYEARQRLREEEIADLDRLNDGILTALRARYDEQRKIEEDALKASSDNWKTWADESVKAIQAQIDALDELTKTEDREAQDAKESRKIEATKQLIAYELDDYNRSQLEKELERLEEARADRLRKNAIADEKERLRAEQEAIRERAQTEQDAIQKQQDELNAVYDERTKDAALRAEAERMMIQGNQDDILALISSYAPDYEATGKTLGERLYAGMQEGLGDITNWFDAFNSQIIGMQNQFAQSALAAADAYYAARSTGSSTAPSSATQATVPVNVNQEYNFYEPVVSPSDVARKTAKANQDLADLLNR